MYAASSIEMARERQTPTSIRRVDASSTPPPSDASAPLQEEEGTDTALAQAHRTIADLQRRAAESEAMIKALLAANLDAVVAATHDDPHLRSVLEGALYQEVADRSAVIDQLPCGVVAYDERGRLLFANPFATELGGDARGARALPAQSLALTPADPATGRAFEAHELPVARALAGETVRSFECILRASPVREERVLRMSSVPRVDDAGKIIGAICTLIDVTERTRLQRELLQSERMACVGTLAAGMAHEINNPLAYILANVAFVAEEIPALLRSLQGHAAVGALTSPRMQEILVALSDAREGAERIRRVVSELKAFAEAKDDVRQLIDVRQCLEDACQIAETEIRHRARLIKDFAPVPQVMASEGRLRQLFLNLLMNAAQSVDDAAADIREIRVTTRSSSEEIFVVVSDSGPGIAASALPRVFDPFFSLRPSATTSGFGLATCETIALAHGGRIEVESELGQGTVFRVTLPKAPGPPPVSRSVPARRGRVLVIDDELAVTDSMKRVLGRDHDVTIALRAADALEILAGTSEFDLILCDVMMPEMGGLELYAKIAEVRPELLPRLAFMTGGAFTARARAFLESVPNARFNKPFSLPELRAFVSARIR